MPWIEDKAAKTKAAAVKGAQVTGQAVTTGVQKTGDALLLAKQTAVNGINMFLFKFFTNFCETNNKIQMLTDFSNHCELE